MRAIPALSSCRKHLRERVSSSDAYPAHRERGVVEVQATLSGLDLCRAPGAVTLLKARADVLARLEMLECSEYLFSGQTAVVV